MSKDIEFNNIINDIINNDKFCQTKEISHHGITRYDHSVKIAYWSYKICKKFNMDYVSTARAGLMHDFFLTESNKNIKGFKLLFSHSKVAADNARKMFNASEFEQEIIKTHMFPTSLLTLPKSKEGFVVAITDKVIGTWEFFKQFQFSMAVKLIFLINIVKYY